MGKNRDTTLLVDLMANTFAHIVVEKHTNKPESRTFLSSEIVEYRGQTKKAYQLHHWNMEDLAQIREKAIAVAKKRLKSKYPDVSFEEKEIKELVDAELKSLSVLK